MTQPVKVRWPLADALSIAGDIRRLLVPACERIEIAGSIRRQRPDVGDIELLCITKPSTLAPFYDDALDELIRGNDWGRETFSPRPSVVGVTAYGKQNKLMLHLPTGIHVDIFSTESRYWGMALFVRTGPKDWNIKAMSRFKQLHMAGHAYGGITSASGQEIDCPDEETVFRNLGWRYVPPKERA